MIIVGTVAHDDIGIPFPNEADDLFPILQGRHQLAVVDVQDFHGRSENFGSFSDLGSASNRQGSAGFSPVTNIPVGHGNELHGMPLSCPHRADASRLEFAVVRVRSEANDSQRFA